MPRRDAMRIDIRRASLCAIVVAGAVLAPAIAGAVSCTASVPSLNFGNYNVFSASALQSATTLSITCAKGFGDPSGTIAVPYTIALSTGGSATYTQRRLASGANTLNYNLYTNSARTLIWGDGTGGSQIVSSSMNLSNGTPQRTRTHTAFGRVPALQDAAVGSYADTLLVTVTY
jgi:spore coat protein U-like protein